LISGDVDSEDGCIAGEKEVAWCGGRTDDGGDDDGEDRWWS